MMKAGHIQMKSVNIKRDELLEKVRTNREQHIDDYQKMVTAYRIKCVEELLGASEQVGKQIEALKDSDGVVELQNIYFDLPRPESHVDDYDQVITMLEMSVDEELEVTAEVFACYVMDRWEWKAAFVKTSAMYLGKG